MTPTTLMRKILLYILSVISLTACSPGSNTYSSYINFESGKWLYNDTITFPMNNENFVSSGSLIIGLRHNNNYPYRNIWIEKTISDSNNTIHSIDTINIELCDIYGQWYGSGVGKSYQLSYKFDKITPSLPKGKIQIRHIMRDDTLSGVEQLGIIYKETEK